MPPRNFNPLMLLILREAVWIAFSVAVAEFFGYVLHRLLHSERIQFLSRSHMEHHLEHYGPTDPMRTPSYVDATDDRASIGNVGVEWILPSAILIATFLALFRATHAEWWNQTLFVAIAIGWSVLMFSYLHDRMHIQDFWMEKSPRLRRWFLRARRLHDIHHFAVDDRGRMNRNFGIGFSFFDRVFGTRSLRIDGAQREALAAARHETVPSLRNMHSLGRFDREEQE